MLKQKIGRWTGRVPGWALVLVFLAITAGVLALFQSYMQTDLEGLYLTPTRTDVHGWEMYRLDETGKHVPLTIDEVIESTEPLCLTQQVDPAWQQAGYTTLELTGPVSVFLDGALLYTTHPGSGNTPEETRLPETYRVPAQGEAPRLALPNGSSGKELTLVFGRGANSHGSPAVILSSLAVDTAVTATAANKTAMPAVAYMTAALFLLGLLFYGGYQGRWELSLLLLTLAAALQSLYQLREYSFQLPYHAALDIPAATLISTLFVALPLLYLLRQARGKHRRLWAALVMIPAALSLIPGLCYMLSISLPGGAYTLLVALLGVSVAAGLACAVEEAWAGNRVFRLFWMGLGALVLVLGAACLFSPALAGYVGEQFFLTAVGFLETPLYWCGAALFVLCAALSVGGAIQRTAEGWAKADMLSTQVSALQGRVEATLAAEEAMRIERHDMRHQLQVVAGMVEKGESAEAVDFIGAFQAHLDALKPARWCQNPVLDAIFSSYLEQAKRQGIEVEASLALPETLPVDALELSTVFANALENAIHACAGVQADQRKIVCKCLSRPQLMFEVSNTYAGEVRFDGNGLPVTDRRGHGVGARSIAAFCEKHGAVCTYEAKDGWFRIRVVL